MQNCATLRNAPRKRNCELPSISNDMQSSETLRNSLGLNYESPALTAELETEAADQITLPRESCREHTEQQRSVLPRSAEIGSREPFSVCSRRKNHAKSSLMAPQLCSDIRHVRQPSHGGALVVRREDVCTGGKLALVKRFLRQFLARESVSVMPARYAWPCDWCSCERKRHRRIRTADSKSEIRLTRAQRSSSKPTLNITLHEDAQRRLEFGLALSR